MTEPVPNQSCPGFHRLTPMATTYRHFVAETPAPVPTGRQVVATGANPWTVKQRTRKQKP
ncbi:hypothetical protein RISK_005785 [Rhodopirellula islandica]|uniref:Uncharacterized protein n=1 Tax=Rhodopirellula islandica TaxID=595434 RepID=A0A0J1EAS9_RHOIS|nr:hypothetical protein RISK_005785 [Rhodopirellula islandica]